MASPVPQPGFLHELSRVAREHRWQLITDMVHTGVMPARWDGDGVIAFVSYHSDVTTYVAGPKTPCVTLSLSAGCASLPRVQPDNFAIGEMAAHHLFARECDTLFWAPFVEDEQNRRRGAGFESTLRLLGQSCLRLPPAHRRLGYAWHDNWTEWRDAFAGRLKQLRGRAGLFAFNDCVASRVLAVARELGVAVPEELAIIGVGNESFDCESGEVALTSIDPDLEGMTRRAVEMLAALLDGGAVPDLVDWKPARVVLRESTGADPFENSRLPQAIALISEQCVDPALGVGTVAEKIGISRRQLERDFRNAKNCTVREFIEDIRMLKASRLLVEQPHLKVLTIAELAGMADPKSFFRKFRGRFGMTPTQFRRQGGAFLDPIRAD